MNLLLSIFLTTLALTSANPNQYQYDFYRFLKNLEPEDVSASETIAVINEFADKILENVGGLMRNLSIDPFPLPDMHINLFPTGYINASSGSMSDMSTIQRNGDCKVIYSSSTRTVQVVIPLLFDDIKIKYDYLVRELIFIIDGGIEGKVKNFKMDLNIGFDFVADHAILNKFDITDSGRLSLHFTGNGLTDWLINLISDAVALVLHPIIINIMELIIKTPVQIVVDIINDVIDQILHPATTTTTAATTIPTSPAALFN